MITVLELFLMLGYIPFAVICVMLSMMFFVRRIQTDDDKLNIPTAMYLAVAAIPLVNIYYVMDMMTWWVKR